MNHHIEQAAYIIYAILYYEYTDICKSSTRTLLIFRLPSLNTNIAGSRHLLYEINRRECAVCMQQTLILRVYTKC